MEASPFPYEVLSMTLHHDTFTSDYKMFFAAESY